MRTIKVLHEGVRYGGCLPGTIINQGWAGVARVAARKLGATFRTSAEFWLNAQKAVDLFVAEANVSKLPPPILKAS